MRQAEKASPPSIDLLPDGFVRAEGRKTYIPATFDRPDYLFAASPFADSNRPVETITPLSQATSVPINKSFSDNEDSALAQSLLSNSDYNSSLVLVCWHYEKIPKLIAQLAPAANRIPETWDPTVFNSVYLLDCSNGLAPSIQSQIEPF